MEMKNANLVKKGDGYTLKVEISGDVKEFLSTEPIAEDTTNYTLGIVLFIVIIIVIVIFL